MLAKILIGFLVGYIFTILYEKGYDSLSKHLKKEAIVKIRGRHIHHSIYGIILLIACILLLSPLLFGTGIGIILRHTQKEKRFVIID